MITRFLNDEVMPFIAWIFAWALLANGLDKFAPGQGRHVMQLGFIVYVWLKYGGKRSPETNQGETQ